VSPYTTAVQVVKYQQVVAGYIPTGGGVKAQQNFIGLINRDSTDIKGVIFGDGTNNNGVFIAKKVSALSDQQIYNS